MLILLRCFFRALRCVRVQIPSNGVSRYWARWARVATSLAGVAADPHLPRVAQISMTVYESIKRWKGI